MNSIATIRLFYMDSTDKNVHKIIYAKETIVLKCRQLIF